MGYKTGVLYEIRPDSKVDASQGAVGISLGGDNLSCMIYCSNTKKDSVSEMNNIRAPEDLDPIIIPGSYPFLTIGNYIAFIGTAEKIELTNVGLKPIKDIS